MIRKGTTLYLEPSQLLFNDYSTGNDLGLDFLDHLEKIKKNEDIIKGYPLNRNLTLVEKQIQTTLSLKLW